MRPSTLQTTYQRNMLIALLITIMIFCVAAAYLLSLSSSLTHADMKTEIIKSKHIPDREVIESSNKAAERSIDDWLQSERSVFLGFIKNIKIIPDSPEFEIMVKPPKIYTRELAPSLESMDDLSFSITEGGNAQGIFVPGNVDFVYGYKHERNKEVINREIQVLNKPDPEYPLIARLESKEGKVTVLDLVDSTGSLAPFTLQLENSDIQTVEYVVVHEEPKDWFFAKKLVQVLPLWTFSPRIQDGKPNCGYLKVTYNYCLGSNCQKLELKQSTAD